MTDSPLCSWAKPAGLIARPISANRKTDRQYLFSIWLPPSKSAANQECAGIVPPVNPAGKKASLRRRAGGRAVIIVSGARQKDVRQKNMKHYFPHIFLSAHGSLTYQAFFEIAPVSRSAAFEPRACY